MPALTAADVPDHTRQGAMLDMDQFLIVDDDQISVLSIKRTLRKLNAPNPVHVAKDGIDALDLLRAAHSLDQSTQPFVVFLDLNMPRMNGVEFIEQVRADASLRPLSIFVMTTTDAPPTITADYDADIAGYVMKDQLLSSFADALKVVQKDENPAISRG